MLTATSPFVLRLKHKHREYSMTPPPSQAIAHDITRFYWLSLTIAECWYHSDSTFVSLELFNNLSIYISQRYTYRCGYSCPNIFMSTIIIIHSLHKIPSDIRLFGFTYILILPILCHPDSHLFVKFKPL